MRLYQKIKEKWGLSFECTRKELIRGFEENNIKYEFDISDLCIQIETQDRIERYFEFKKCFVYKHRFDDFMFSWTEHGFLVVYAEKEWEFYKWKGRLLN